MRVASGRGSGRLLGDAIGSVAVRVRLPAVRATFPAVRMGFSAIRIGSVAMRMGFSAIRIASVAVRVRFPALRKTPSASASLRTSNPRPNGARRTRFPYVGPLNHLAASGSAAVVEGLPWCARPKAWPRFEGLTGRTSVEPCDDSLPFYGSQPCLQRARTWTANWATASVIRASMEMCSAAAREAPEQGRGQRLAAREGCQRTARGAR